MNIHGGNNRIAERDYYEVKQLEGDLVVERQRPFMRADDPNIVRCPFGCGELTWWNSHECWNCRRPVHQYFIDKHRQARREVLNNRALVASLIGVGLMLLASQLPSDLSLWAVLPGLGSWCFAGICGKAAENL